MATSGQYTSFVMQRDDIIKGALRLNQVQLRGTTPSAQQITEAAEALNMMVKAWQTDGMPLWAMRRVYVLPQNNTNSYSAMQYEIPVGTGHITTSPAYTTLTVAKAAGQTAMTVSSITGFSNGDNIGVATSSGLIHWTTINGAPSGSTITLTSALPNSAAAGAAVYGYATSTRAPRFLRVDGAWNIRFSDSFRWQVQIVDNDTIARLSGAAQGNIIQVSYLPEKFSGVSASVGSLYIYPGFQDANTVLELRVEYPFQDFTASTDEPDFPQEWYEAVKYGLAVRLAPEYGLSNEQRLLLKKEAEDIKQKAIEGGLESGSMYFQPMGRYGY